VVLAEVYVPWAHPIGSKNMIDLRFRPVGTAYHLFFSHQTTPSKGNKILSAYYLADLQLSST
jgi:hypothetical protein